jgi:dihydrodipicolinate synthase/N-acetylneuraminate lyase
VDLVDPGIIVSGMGEQPAIVHMRDFKLAGFTSGCVCVNPELSQEMLEALRSGDNASAEAIREIFRPLEDLRNDIHPVRVLHDAVALGGIAETGPILPLLSNLTTKEQAAVKEAALDLRETNPLPQK